mgnify:CR=1 FL=1
MLIIFIIAISLSMDAFSLALAYGTLNLNKKDIYKISITVGIYHFIMPLIGMMIGTTLIHHLKIEPILIVFLILSFIGVQMIYETFREEQIKPMINFKEILLFGLAVSIDSFSVGISLKVINENFILSALIFSIFSFIFTYFGLVLGKKINNLVGKSSTILGGLVLIIIGIIYLIK